METEPKITPEVISLQDAINLLNKVQNREEYLNTSVYETQYALVLAVVRILNESDWNK